ncbi:YEATS domain-containing protein 2 [Pogonomyrmex barbatus]|uniref:YEATS domain-containing protein 2 n=1 Tax=Pogonomyrmex barbatus TaxID=144034 RepID=A0A6I9XFU8_9HYME|nr:YEATS domain-containing protein 2 [Pogonomyrmex barbatus]XP_011644167.1 YEATS domain-containing protein 2 [Pogonomyrmex barbatus]
MSTLEELLNDPDYITTISSDELQQKVYEENARNITAKKITAIVEKEFSREIDLKEKEILQIQERLHKTLKIFHFLRYIIITNFYNRKQCQIPQATETSKQTRIHPAIKTLLGKCPKSFDSSDLAVPSTSTDPRFLCNDKSVESDANTTDSTIKIEENTNKCNNVQQGEKRKLLDEESQPRKIPRYVPPKSSVPEKTSPSRGNSNKVRKRIIVGNISRWIPPDWREDPSSHKWTMYVRGDKDENADISTFVSKVRFFLHPSYRPNDVVEVTSYPFHLSRRGWGEFPLRVQLHFKNALNKPVDIIHHLKLDCTYTGLQTLGSETLVDLWIYTREFYNPEQNNSNKSVESSVNNTFVKVEPNDKTKLAKTLEFTANTMEKIQIKEESDLKIHESFNSSLDLIENSKPIRVKVESNDIFNDKNNEPMNHYIEHDHNYFSRQYFNSRHCTIREGNMTVEHFPENECTMSVINSPTVDDNKEQSETMITSYRFNGDIQSSSNCQPLVSPNAKIDNSLMNETFHEYNKQKDLSLTDVDKSLQTKNSKNKNTSRISENISIKDVSMTNGFRKSNVLLDRLQGIANSSNCNSHLKPLQISIPSSNIFSSSTNKRVLLLKDKKSISVNFSNVLSSKSNENSKMLLDSDAKVSVPRDGNVAKLNIRVPQGVSILKKSLNIKADAQQEDTVNNNKKTAVLKLNTTNSLLLNVNENVPILKIADNYRFAEATSGTSTGKEEVASCRKSEDKTMQRPKITLGKDKFKIQSKRELYEAVLQSINDTNITDVEALIRFIARRLPIVTQNARDPEYRRLHSYACCTEDEYLAYNIGKQCAMEWYRAKMIRRFLRAKLIPDDQLWSIKEIMLWARFHGYTPNRPRSTFDTQETVGTSDTKKLPNITPPTAILSTCTEPIASQEWLQLWQSNQSKDISTEDEEIDVENIRESPRRITIDRRKYEQNNDCSTSSALIPVELDEDLLPFHNFICNTARDIGIKIGPEEIVPGVLYCAASRVIMRVIECFVEDLTRSSLAKAWERNGENECPKVITLNDVRDVLATREEFDIFTNKGLGSKQEFNITELSRL